jgi:hypothetical protein
LRISKADESFLPEKTEAVVSITILGYFVPSSAKQIIE